MHSAVLVHHPTYLEGQFHEKNSNNFPIYLYNSYFSLFNSLMIFPWETCNIYKSGNNHKPNAKISEGNYIIYICNKDVFYTTYVRCTHLGQVESEWFCAGNISIIGGVLNIPCRCDSWALVMLVLLSVYEYK